MELNVQKPIRNYETVIIMHPDTSEEDQKALFRKNQEIIKRSSGQVSHIDTWGKRRLANTINKIKVGIYFHSTFTAKSECVEELERTMRINDRVLRFFHTRLDDRRSIEQHLQGYRDVIAASKEREQEREAKVHARKAQSKGAKSPRREKGASHSERFD